MEILGNKLKRFFDIVDNPPNDAEITYAGNRYEVWEVSEDLFNKMCDMSEEEFVKLAGEEAWWRQSDGSVLGVPDTKFIINGEEMVSWNTTGQIKENLKTVLTLEYMGIHIEDTKEQGFKQLYFFSVPERSTLKIESAKEQAETADDLIQVAKAALIEMILNSCKSEFDDGEEDEEFYKDVENNISDYALFFAKVRKGEVWNKEMGKAAVNKAVEPLKNLSYKQV